MSEDNFDLSDTVVENPSTKEETSSDRPSAQSYIFLSDSVGSLTPTARCILDELKDWHKRLEKHGSKEKHASYLMTVDKLPEALGKYTNLGTQGRTENSIYHALRQILDIDHRGQNRAAYAYPYLIRTGSKISSKIALVAPQNENKTDTQPYRQACFRFSQDLIKVLLENRAKKGRNWDEENPGSLLLQKNKEGNTWLYPKLGSLEAEISSLVRKGFGNLPYIPMPDFLQDFTDFAREQNLALPILSDYHIVIDELNILPDGSFKRLPEVVNQILAHMNGLEHFSKDQLTKLAKDAKYESFLATFSDYISKPKFSSLESKMNPEEEVKKFLSIIESFPFPTEKGNKALSVKETIELSVKILKRLSEEKGSVLTRKDDSIYGTVKNAVISKIPEHTKNHNTLLRIDFEEEVAKAGITSEEKANEYIKRLKDDVFSDHSYYEEKLPDGRSVYYVVDHGYMAAVIHKLAFEGRTNPEYKKQLGYAKIINHKLSNPKHPELNNKLKPELIAKLNADVKNMEVEELEKERSNEIRSRFNVVPGILTFVVSTLIFITGAYYLRSAMPIFFGVPFSVVLGFMAAIYFREKSTEEIREDIKNSGKFSGIGDWGKPTYHSSSSSSTYEEEEETSKKDEKLSNIYKAADNFVFPKRFNKITDKVLDPKSLRSRIYENLDNIKRNNMTLGKEKDNDKVASTVEYAVLQSVSTVVIPDDVAIRDLPNTILINRNDMKSALFRGQLADHYREEMNKKKFDKKLVKYYTYLINTIEMEYYKYLPKKRV
ncbi:hypothetical protein ND861_17105 [Leptospira sp. 2 VSF19]|uniref:Uncharacterized protein n=1 Tax=Leptospira soteropolitanensis TaxID=2950025 RepID=A0AAW5VSQ6_9LEPT|nr:hypothetical protein [Leptospira soteropolitanensis]MCW7494367.1 hypothetical protein [Leptospira soteropolitanensis]MCW7501924.1 hypothetical protein [Leptospira soteropolitanensis]MCW7524213.1 hypothetical protein [Leptospira soteropolitanensis]MCW7528078.1 hypothetical protein [Leptospira soteropolitanensis]MCW7531932.1 hypothetical protein [Leptospira soteropolitanensis]